MKTASFKLLLTLFLAVGFAKSYGQTLIWSDEFNGTEIDRSIWSNQCGNSGFGNGEFQCYTDLPTNSRVEAGSLVLQARREVKEGKNFTSARLTTLGKFAFQYGSIEARIKLPDVYKGLWPAFWLMGTNLGRDGWPKCGEIDIMEVGSKEGWSTGTANSKLSGAVHWDASGQADYGVMKDYPATPFNTAFHTYRLDWTPTSLTMTFDGDKYYEIAQNATMEEFKAPQFILLNLAVGGFNFAQITNEADITATFPAKMEVDYIRLYSNADTKIFTPTSANPYSVPLTGDYGVFTENHTCNSKLDYTTDAKLNIWNGLTVATTTPAEGTEVQSFNTIADKWFGFGIISLDKNMTNYADGTLHFKMKVPAGLTVPIKIGVESTISGGSGNNFVWLNSTNTYGLVRDGQWHDVNIPLNEIADIDFTYVKHTFFVAGDIPGGVYNIAFDDIYWIPSAARKAPNTGTFAIYSETVATTNNRVVIGADARIDIWGGNTLVKTTTAAAEGSEALAFTGGGQGWWGMAVGAISKYNLMAYKYSDCNLSFKVKSTDNATFYVGLRSGNEYYKGIKYITLSNGSGAYDFARNGQWQTITVPLSEFYSTSDFSLINGLFVAYGVTNISNVAFDDIYLTNGHASPTALPEQIAQNDILFFPNPVENKLCIVSEGNSFSTYQITSVDGRLVDAGSMDSSVETQEINTSNLQSGIYFVTLQNDSQKVTRKIIKK